MNLYEIEIETASGERKRLGAYAGKVLLIVNTASECGYTPQFAGLEALHRKYSARGLVVLGFPCNQFAGQEPGDAQQAQAFCQINYGVDFPMHAKVDVNGPHKHPLFAALREAAPGVLGTTTIKWNFTKFLVDRTGTRVERFATATEPAELEARIEELLAQ